MSSTTPFRPVRRRSTRVPSALERLTAAYARSHHAHEAPIVGCYLCLHNVARRPVEAIAAAA